MRWPATTLALGAVLALAATLPSSAAAVRGPCVIGTKTPKCNVWTGKVGAVDDGDTINVDVNGDGTRRKAKIRLTGIQAMELTRYGKKRGRRGECNGVRAAERLEQLIRRGRSRVRIAALRESSTTGRRGRLRRHIAVKSGGRWVDAGAVLLQEGLALWFANPVEWAWNRTYSRLAEQAAARSLGIWNDQSCGAGPSQSSGLTLKVKWDAEDNDAQNINGEWARITNSDPLNDVSLAGWWFRDSHLRRYQFPSGATVPAGGSIRLHVGRGANDADTFHWGLNESVFENATDDKKQIGDGGYLFDPAGDLRAYVQYPCRTSCAEPLSGKVALVANYRAPEYVTIRNTSNEVLDLNEYELESVPWFYEFGPNSLLPPRQSLQVYIQRAPLPVGVLMRSWGHREYLLADRRDVVTLRNPRGAPVVCHAWGGMRCPSV